MFISIEGGEGAGKSTLIEGLKRSLEELGMKVLVTREPGGTPLGEKLRELLLSKDHAFNIAPSAELLLMLAARAQHIEEVIRPALIQGTIVICDRFNHSTIAYQGAGRGLGIDFVSDFCKQVCGQTVPDRTFYLDIDPEEGLQRTKKLDKELSKSGESDRIESEKMEFHKKIRDAFVQMSKEDSRLIPIDATLSIEEVLKQALEKVHEAIRNYRK